MAHHYLAASFNSAMTLTDPAERELAVFRVNAWLASDAWDHARGLAGTASGAQPPRDGTANLLAHVCHIELLETYGEIDSHARVE